MAFESKQSVSQSVSQQGGYRAARAAKKAETNQIHIFVTFSIHKTRSFGQEGFRFGSTSDHILS